jgi:zinc transporter ZupT
MLPSKYMIHASWPHCTHSLAIAIALHNIPEGVAVALPVYFATGERWHAQSWCRVCVTVGINQMAVHI